VVKFPATFDELEAAGYVIAPAKPKECSCGMTFLWWITPNGKWMPISSLKDSRLVPHHAVCQRVKEFRAANEKHAARAEGKKPVQTDLFGGK
jgi:hypothetical protein